MRKSALRRTRSLMPFRRLGWAIQTDTGYIGQYWFDDVPERRFAGHRLMIWETRREARAALTRIRVTYGFRTARVVRVVVTVRAAHA